MINRRHFVLLLSLICVTAACVEKGGDERGKEEANLERLQSLPYISAIPVTEEESRKVGVTRHDPGKAFPGPNLFSPRDEERAILMDMEGRTLHEWSARIDEKDGWQHVEPGAGGDLFAILKNKALIRLGWDSEIEWIKNYRCHHDIAVAEDGSIYTATRDERIETIMGVKVPILDDYLSLVSPEGEPRRRISLFKLLGHLIPKKRIDLIGDWAVRKNFFDLAKTAEDLKKIQINPDNPADVFHLNSIEIIGRDLPGLCKKGDLLISVRELDMVAIVDFERKEILWKWGEDELEAQHHPSLLDNGNILIFDNGIRKGFSRIVEVDPLAGGIVWEYRDAPSETFFSRSRGAAQRLPNGNTLVTESDRGRAFEVTLSGKIVWEYYAPVRTRIVDGETKKERAPIYRMIRITDRSELKFPKF
jgi:hypothetical protein